MGLFGTAHADGGPKNLSHISYNDETWHSYTLPKENTKKQIYHVTHPLSSPVISIFSLEIDNFCYFKKYEYRLHFNL